jgi:site-specific recombinase XerD
MQSLRRFGRFAVIAGLRNSSPAHDVRLLDERIRPVPSTLTEAEVTQLAEVAQCRPSRTAPRDLAILQLVLHSGIRVSELVRLRLADIDLRDHYGTLTIRGHGDHRGRRMPLNEVARRALRTYLQQPRSARSTHVFVSWRGKPLPIPSVQRVVANLGEAVGLEISAGTLRDTYARNLWRNTGDLSLLAERLGHKGPEAVLKYMSTLPTTGPTTEVY